MIRLSLKKAVFSDLHYKLKPLELLLLLRLLMAAFFLRFTLGFS